MLKTALRNTVVTLAAIILGAMFNGLIIQISPNIIPPPAGADLQTEEGLKAAMLLMEPKHFLMPWLAHALGTLLAAFIATRFATRPWKGHIFICGGVFFLGGAMMVNMLPSPLWFTLLDLGFAYFPMAWLGYWLAKRSRNANIPSSTI